MSRGPKDWFVIHATRAKLAIMFPGAIMPKDSFEKRPLKKGIYGDLRAATEGKISPADLRATINVYCNSPRYLAAMVEGAERVDLQGNPDGIVTAEAAAFAARQLQFLNAPKEQRAQLRALEAELSLLKGAVRTARGCFAAAQLEGLDHAIAETNDERLRDLLTRRVLVADFVLGATGLEPTHD